MIRMLVSLLFVAILSGSCVSGGKDDAADICDGNPMPSVYLVVELFMDADSPAEGEVKIDSFSLTDGCNVYTPDAPLFSFCSLPVGNYRQPIARGTLCRVCYPMDNMSAFDGLLLQVCYSCFYDTDEGCGVVEVVQRIPLQIADSSYLIGALECGLFESGQAFPFVLKFRCVVAPRRRFFFL